MEKNSGSKKENAFQIILCIAVVGLIATVIIQNRNIEALTKTKNNISLVENVPPAVKAETAVVEEKQPVMVKKQKKDKIFIPEQKTAAADKQTARKADDIPQSRQAGQLLEKLASEVQMNPAMENLIRGQAEKRFHSIYDSFAEEYNLSPQTEIELIDLLVEKQLENLDIASLAGEVQKGNITRDDLQQEVDYVNILYDEKISELLSPEEFEAFKEYEKYEEERLFLSEFKNNMEYTGGIQLDRLQEKDLVAAMHNEKQKLDGKQNEFQQTIDQKDPLFSSENLKKGFERQKELLSRYLESSRDILSDFQQERLGEYIDSQKSILDMGATLLGKADQEKTNM